ncbi:MAG: VOC family protein [Planctomycetaceae bacterium]|nr:VOC family protein [Planctomycetales bacterium]MCB9874493.1 VOC family protein [Planctomycetaceae bacterium]HRX82727.1 ArsI/CadI family heavy metal resistance metalloenzyme [Pirellulaceae bacterium]
MSNNSVVQFETESRIHMGLAIKDLEKSVAFYTSLFGQPPTKTRSRYAKFEVSDLPVNLSLNEVGGETGPNNPVAHFGVQLKSSAAVKDIAEWLGRAGVAKETEDQVTCCYAVQDKVWASDPDGNRWEVYVVLDDNAAQVHSTASECCPQIPAIMEELQQGDLAATKRVFDRAGTMSAGTRLAAGAPLKKGV